MTYGSILVLALSLSSQVSDKPVVKYDKFDDRTTIYINLGKVPGEEAESRITLLSAHDGKKPEKVDHRSDLVFMIYRSGEDFKYKDDSIHEVRMVCGDERIRTWLPYYESKAYGKICVENFAVHLNLMRAKDLLKTNKDWEVKIDLDDPFVLNAKYRAKMLTLIRFLEEGGG
jgi:hypothetical protein